MKILKESRAKITKVTLRTTPSPSGVTFRRGFVFSFNIIRHLSGQRPQPGRDYVAAAPFESDRADRFSGPSQLRQADPFFCTEFNDDLLEQRPAGENVVKEFVYRVGIGFVD